MQQKRFLKPTLIRLLLLLPALALVGGDVFSFCGFYVAKAGAELFNNKSQVIIVRDGNKNVVTMSNDFKGSAKDFALVVPVPVVLKKDDVRVVERGIFERIDAYSAPRLVEYWDHNPCEPQIEYDMLEEVKTTQVRRAPTSKRSEMKNKDYRVKVEAEYTVGEYDIVILSAEESNGLQRWLTDNGYKIPAHAERLLDPYIKSNNKFFVVKVNTEELNKTGFNYLRPIQIRFESQRFGLPIRLGMSNSEGEQDMLVYAFTRTGRIETVNYRTVKIPTDKNIPLYVQKHFDKFYVDLYNKAHGNENRNAVFLEYAWNVSPTSGMKCDPCVSPPPVFDDFKQAGVDWVQGMSGNVFFTRLHVRYSDAKFPQDLVFQLTPNSENFQARYILTHPATGDLSCSEGRDYLQTLINRRERETQELAALTGWDVSNYEYYLKEYKNLKENYEENNQKKEKKNSFEFFPGNNGGKGPDNFLLLMAVTVMLIAMLGYTAGKKLARI